ncbi:FeoA domain-containing protein [Clostridium sp.]|uniref:FeoA family protein n=1 Tax=Clostridium sp. TaxID=1506 RepID=UPI00258E61CF|nr:FeoA domain-containing protein [Clostridium sp.]
MGRASMPLNSLRMGESGSVDNIVGGEILCKKLMEMGFNKGAVIHVVKNDSGALIVKVGGTKLVVARGMAQKVMMAEM